MHYYLEANVGDQYENFIMAGVLYNSKGEIVDTIFNPGVSLKETYGKEKFTIIVNEKESTKGKLVDIIRGFFSKAGRIFVASDKACALFQNLGLSNLEYFDVSIQLKDEKIINYKIINIIGKIDCIDDDQSEIKYWDNGTIKYIYSLVFDENKIPHDKKIFLLGRQNSASIFVHESVKQAIEENLEGFTLIPVDEYIVD